MNEERQELIVKVIGQITEDMANGDVDQVINLLNDVPNEKLKQFLKGE